MRHSLHLRIAGIGVLVMALTLAVAALLTHELIEVGYRQELDRVLQQELDEVRLGLPEELVAAAGEGGILSNAEADLAVQRYLAVHPGSERHLTVVQIGSRRLSTRDGPRELVDLQRRGALPDGRSGSLTTVDSAAGPLRVLSAPINDGQSVLGGVTVLGPLFDGRDQANDALIRIVGAGGLGLASGGLLLLLAVRRALQPVRELATAARGVDLADLDSRVPSPRRLDEVGLMAQEFNRMLERISKDEQQRQRLLSAISHELRTPLAVARGHLELFETLGPEQDGSASDTAAVVRRELDRLGRIVDDLAAVSRGDLAGDTARDPVFAPDVFSALRHRLNGLGLDDIEVTAAPPVVLLGDEDRLAQALLNLVANARTHTTPATSVRVSARARDGRIVFQVADDGPGVDAGVLPRVFEPFVTTRPAGSSRASGLGLAVVKAVTEAQGGLVDLDTGPAGTTVSLSFPIDAAT